MIRTEIDWKKIESASEKLKYIVRQFIEFELSHEESVEQLFLLFAVLSNFEDGDRSQTAYLASEIQQYVFSFTKPQVDAFYKADKEVLKGFYGEEVEPAETSAPFDLSESSIEDLSMKLSDIMRNPNLPTDIRTCISAELFTDFTPDTADPKIIQSALENLQGGDDA